jgi:hypothetical protein
MAQSGRVGGAAGPGRGRSRERDLARAQVPLLVSQPREGLEHHPVGVVHRGVGLVVGRRDLDHVQGDQRVSRAMVRTARSRSAGVIPPGSGVPVPGAKPGSSTSMSTER